MKIYFKGKDWLVHNSKRIAFFFMLSAGIFSWFVMSPDSADSGTYLDSAHGSSSYGVKRTANGFPDDYPRGLCAHCHEQHASINGNDPDPAGGPDKYMLLANNFSGATLKPYNQNDNVCFYCHSVTGTLQDPVFYNNSYSSTFGGETAGTDSIFDTFNKTSYHNLNDVLNFARNNFGATFKDSSNPCSVCHNSHLAKRNKANQGNPAYTVISKPSSHSTLWGDDTAERMNNYSAYYLSPFYVGANPFTNPTQHEPDGVSRQISSNEVKGLITPDYVTFCTECHNVSYTVYSNTLGGNLRSIDWSASGDQHGQGDGAGTTSGNLKAPYTSDGTSSGLQVDTTNFVCSCTDCHEPHGSNNEYLLRTTVNGTTVSIDSPGKWYNFCLACHTLLPGAGDHSIYTVNTTCNSALCHNHGANF